MRLPVNLPRQWLLPAACAGLGLLLVPLYFLVLKSPAPVEPPALSPGPVSLETAVPDRPGAGLPTRLSIPAIQVDSRLEQTGLTPQGDVDTPEGPASAAWFKLWPRPGDIGSSVIVGHFGWKDNLAAVFDDLHKLKPGDKVYVEDETGRTLTFIVRELRTYGRRDVATDVFHSNDSRAHLNLITCQGTWNRSQDSYSSRLVVFTDMVEV